MEHAHHMDHSTMDHSGHGGHDGMGEMCSMNMLFTWDTTNLCIVFRQWHVQTTPGLVFSLLAVVLIGVGYEGIRAAIRRYEVAMSKRIETMPSDGITETTPLAWATGQNQPQAGQRAHLVKAVLYALQTFYAFMLMLIFMTYNGWIMAAVTTGAFVGYAVFGTQTSATKETQCH